MPHVCNQMNVVGHYNETASEPAIARWAVEEKRNEALKGFIVGKNASAVIDAQRQKIGNIAITIRPDTMKTPEAMRRRFVSYGRAV